MASTEDFTYTSDEWHFPIGHMHVELKLHLERWCDGQIHLQCVEEPHTRLVVGGWLDDGIREWVQTHQHKLSALCDEYLDEANDNGYGARVDYAMDRMR